MDYRRLGRTGLSVSAFGLGTWQTFGESIDDLTAQKVLKTALENGVNYIDGAEAYGKPHGRGVADEVLGRVLANLGWPREDVILASKVSCWKNREVTWRGTHRKHTIECCEASLKRWFLALAGLACAFLAVLCLRTKKRPH